MDWNRVIEHGLFNVAPIITAIGFIWLQVRRVHTIVNSQRTEMMDKIERLEKLLAAKNHS